MGKFLAYFLLFQSIFCNVVMCYPSYLLDDEGCAKQLEEGVEMMGKAIQLDRKKKVEILVTKVSDGSQYMNGDTYTPGDKIIVTLGGAKGYHVIETDNGSFQQGKCYGKRTSAKNPTLELPVDGNVEVNLKVGWAAGYGPVKLTAPFTLAPSADMRKGQIADVDKIDNNNNNNNNNMEETTTTTQGEEKIETTQNEKSARQGQSITKIENHYQQQEPQQQQTDIDIVAKEGNLRRD